MQSLYFVFCLLIAIITSKSKLINHIQTISAALIINYTSLRSISAKYLYVYESVRSNACCYFIPILAKPKLSDVHYLFVKFICKALCLCIKRINVFNKLVIVCFPFSLDLFVCVLGVGSVALRGDSN